MSTQKQGEGVSLEAQKDAITVFASRNDLTVTKWFEEKETAAKLGRPKFNQLIKELKAGKANGVIFHKIDRSTRNPTDWARIHELSDRGVEIHYAMESINLSTRGGKLTADIQAVIAADYIRNLREECIKGMNGRLKQGLYPFKAPLGYLDQGGGKQKIICPQKGPLVKLAFELYASRQYSYLALLDELHARGLRNTRGGKLTLNGLTTMFTNQFYIGVIHVKTTGKTYQGIHEPLISVATWRRAQSIRENRSGPKVTKHNHLFQGLFHCANCANPMVPELQKGRVYYRCKRTNCQTKTIREDALEQAIRSELSSLELSARAESRIHDDIVHSTNNIAEQRAGIKLQVKDEERRLDRLQDLLLDDAIPLDTFHQKQNQLQLRLAALRERLQQLPDPQALAAHQAKLAELRKNLVFLYDNANRAQKRCIVEIVWPNRTVSGKQPLLEPDSWLSRCEIGDAITEGEPQRDRGRTTQDMADNHTPLIQPLFDLLEQYKHKPEGGASPRPDC